MIETVSPKKQDQVLQQKSDSRQIQPNASPRKAARRRRKFCRRKLLTGIIGFGYAAMASIGFISYVRNDDLRLAQLHQQKQKSHVTDVDPFTEHVKQSGITTCASTFVSLGKALTSGTSFSTQTQWVNTHPDTYAIRSLVGMSYTTGTYIGSAVGIVNAVPVGSSCEGSIVRVVPFQQSCRDTTKFLPQGSKLDTTLNEVLVYTTPDQGGQIMLMPAGVTCVAVTVAQMLKLQ